MASKKRASTSKHVGSSTSHCTRGATMAKEVTKAIANGQKFEIQWDSDGQSIGPHSAELKSFIGTTVKRLVAITYDKWPSVPDTLKDMVWKEVLTAFILPKEKKSWLLKVANVLWRRFKSDLTRFHMYDKDGVIRASPPAIYAQYVNEAQWVEFTEVRQSTPFKESSEAHRQLSLRNQYTYLGSRQGYSGIGQAMRSELDIPVVPRHQVWKRARRHKDGHYSADVQEVVDKMELLSEQEKAGEIVFDGRDDLLSRTLEKREHPGRVRGVSQYATITDYFGHASRGKAIGGSDGGVAMAGVVQEMKENMNKKLLQMEKQHAQSQEESQAQIQEMKEVIVQLLDKMKKDNPDLPTPKFRLHMPQVSEVCTSDEPSPAVQSTPLDLVDEEYVPCDLFWPSMTQKVARGSVCRSSSGVILHHRLLEPGFVKVQVIIPLKAEVKLPRPTDEAHNVIQAVGGFVAWPAQFVSTITETPNSKDKRIGATNEASIHISSTTSVNSYTERITNFIWYHRAMGKTPRSITLSESIMGYEPTIMIGKFEIGLLLEQKEIEASHVSFYIKYLWDKHCSSVEHMFGFLCPSSVSPVVSRKTMRECQQYVANAITGDIAMKMVFAPYNLGLHWVLVAINVKDDTVYYLDPLSNEISLDAQILFDTSLKMFWAKKNLKKPRVQTRWVKVHCPRSSNSESGYYVLRFMREIVEKRYTNSIPAGYYRRQHKTYSQEEVDEIRVEWLEYFSELNDI